MNSNITSGGRVVVGVDGSMQSQAALRWAFGYASLTGAMVDAIIAWEFPGSGGWGPVPVASRDDYETECREVLDRAVHTAAGAEPGVKVREMVEYGHPAEVLIEASRGADLLVVGSRGHGAFAAALLGSVSQNCVHHASCPVMVIRGDATA